jgi:hypothetical protein
MGEFEKRKGPGKSKGKDGGIIEKEKTEELE